MVESIPHSRHISFFDVSKSVITTTMNEIRSVHHIMLYLGLIILICIGVVLLALLRIFFPNIIGNQFSNIDTSPLAIIVVFGFIFIVLPIFFGFIFILMIFYEYLYVNIFNKPSILENARAIKYGELDQKLLLNNDQNILFYQGSPYDTRINVSIRKFYLGQNYTFHFYLPINNTKIEQCIPKTAKNGYLIKIPQNGLKDSRNVPGDLYICLKFKNTKDTLLEALIFIITFVLGFCYVILCAAFIFGGLRSIMNNFSFSYIIFCTTFFSSL